MFEDLITRAATLMQEQADAYRRLEAACAQLSAAMVRGVPEQIESFSRAGESELLRMRSRLGEIMGTLSAFAEQRAAANEIANKPATIGEQTPSPLAAEARLAFENASNELLEQAHLFERTHARASALATNGSTFASACIEMCGVLPTTYRAPYARLNNYGGGKQWA